MSPNRMPVVFVGHGSPMNAIEDNEFSRAWTAMGKAVPKPTAILSISAHWEARGSWVTAMTAPRTIHDFYGFPDELYRIAYPAPGSPALAERIGELSVPVEAKPDLGWGLDHGTWSVLKRMYPKADIPVVQLSLDRSLDPSENYDLGRRLRPLRDEGVLILGTGNIVHNLRLVEWEGEPFPWAEAFDRKVKETILSGRHAKLADYGSLGESASLAVNTAEHYLPLLYVLGAMDREDQVGFYAERVWGGSVSMRSFIAGRPAG
jgi:4,5-DOPA dioxygenase extradiol